jgi:hypothetical protein
LRCFLPPSLFSASQFCMWIPHPRPDIAFSPRVNSAESGRGGGGVAWVALWRAFSPNTEISFLMISPYLLDICPVFLLVFSPLETADFLMLFQPLGDGYSLLCSQKSSFRGTIILTITFVLKSITSCSIILLTDLIY